MASYTNSFFEPLQYELDLYSKCITGGNAKNGLLFVFPSHKISVRIVSPVLHYGGLAGS
jgi:hypothetical protein